MLAAVAATALVAAPAVALELDLSFGAARRGYVPVSAVETQVDSVAAITKQDADHYVVLGTRLVGTRGTLLLQRYGADGTPDLFFGQFGTATIDIAGTSLTAKALWVREDGTLVVVAATANGPRLYHLTATGQPDATFGSGGVVQIPLASGAQPGTTSLHPLANGRFLAISQNPPAASGLFTVTRYTAAGAVDEANFGLSGREVISNLGAGVVYSGVATLLEDQRIAVLLTGPGATRALLMLDSNGQLDAANNGKPVQPAALQGKAIVRLAPLLKSYFIAVAVTGSGSTQSTELVRFDPSAHVDLRFGSGGVLAVDPSGSGGGLAINELFETVDGDLVLTGTANNGLVVARYHSEGAIDLTFNDGKGVAYIAEPGSIATIGVASVQESNSRIVTVANALLYGTTPSGVAPSRAFIVSLVAGKPDVDYAAKGVLTLFGQRPPEGEYIERVVPLNDGRVLVVSATGAGQGLIGALSRFNADGSADATFGTNGRATFGLNGRCEWPLSVALQADGSILVLGTSFNTIDCSSSSMFGKRIGANGLVDPGFQLIYSGAKQRGRSGAMALQADGRIVVTGQDDKSLVVARYMPSGFTDPSFASGGAFLVQPNASDDVKGGAVLVKSDQKVLVAGSLNGVQLVLLQLNPDGTRDAQFGVNGVAVASVVFGILDVQGIAITSAGNILVVARAGDRALLAQFHANGTPDLLFGNNGQVQLPIFSHIPQYSHFGLAIEADGGIVVSGRSTSDVDSAAAVVRVTPIGAVDPTFGTNGMQRLRPSIYYTAGANDIALTASGTLYVGGFGLPGAFLARYGIAIVPAHVLEFYNTTLNHYFITADPAEQAAIDAGAAGPGWTRTGIGFRAFTPSTGIPAGMLPVCRFYGSTAIDPATGLRRGPNSHFYTAQAAECAAVQLDLGWTLEGFAFYTLLPQANGQCASGLVPVFRNYNNRAQFNDSNHRYSTDAAIYALMQSQGWAAEGIVFCGAP